MNYTRTDPDFLLPYFVRYKVHRAFCYKRIIDSLAKRLPFLSTLYTLFKAYLIFLLAYTETTSISFYAFFETLKCAVFSNFLNEEEHGQSGNKKSESF